MDLPRKREQPFETTQRPLRARTRDRVCITGVEPKAEFLADLMEVSS